MTLIATLLDRNGIALATDSNVTANGQVTREARKNFEISCLCAGLSIAGCYDVEGKPMDEWMPEFIEWTKDIPGLTLESFVDCLRKALDSGMTREEKRIATIVHIAGYSADNGSSHPEFHCVSNVDGINADGSYHNIRDTFSTREDFWSRDCQRKGSRAGFGEDPEPYDFSFYANGFPDARAACFSIIRSLEPGFSSLWNHPYTSFRHPKSLEDTKCFLRMLMGIVGTLFQMSDYPIQYVGGEIQIIGIPLPA